MAEDKKKRPRPAEGELLQRRQRLLEMRAVKTPWQKIVDELGYGSIAHACVDYKRTIDGLREDIAMTREQIVQEELEHLEMLTRTALDVLSRPHVHVSGGKVARDTVFDDEGNERPGDPLLDDGPVLQAIESLRRLSERRAKLLGIDAPTRVEAEGELKVIVEGVNTEEMK